MPASVPSFCTAADKAHLDRRAVGVHREAKLQLAVRVFACELRLAELAVDRAGDLGALDLQIEGRTALLALHLNRDGPFTGDVDRGGFLAGWRGLLFGRLARALRLRACHNRQRRDGDDNS